MLQIYLTNTYYSIYVHHSRLDEILPHVQVLYNQSRIPDTSVTTFSLVDTQRYSVLLCLLEP